MTTVSVGSCWIRSLAVRSGRAADHLLRRRHRRAHRVVHGNLANWAAKTGNLLRDELGAGPASRVAVLLPAHWQTAAVLFGIWWIGAEVVLDGPAPTSRCAPPTGSTRPTTPSARGGGGAVVGPVRQAGRRSAGRRHRLRHRGAGAWRPDLARTPSRARAGRPVGRPRSSSVPKHLRPHRVSPQTTGCSRRPLGYRRRADRQPAGRFRGRASLVQVANPDPSALDRRRQTEKITRG